ncbi:UvrD-helicase domain-containing protein [Mangrovibacterium marinum]|nr:UvrD-helicase domain-containing protein [Mangrovibacterium marinum]
MSKEEFATDDEIRHASKVLLPKEHCFMDDEEKVNIIKCNESKDIVACPGSGKTTTLLAKLLILANRMPLEGNRGVCVLTHTNVAIDEIKEKLGAKSDVLFRYPNHFGTIQSFVDKFLTSPYFIYKYGNKLISIDNERYRAQFDKSQFKYMGKKAIAYCHRTQSKGFPYTISLKDFELDEDNKCIRLGLDLSKADGHAIYDGLRRTKDYSIESGYLTYMDAYDLAELFLSDPDTTNNIIDSFANRFQYVFIDEMQDTAKHQLDILGKVFDSQKTIIQRFGDPSQSIYNKVSVEEVWTVKDSLPINTSKRFGDNIGEVLKTVCIKDNSALKASPEINSLSPILILYDNPLQVLPKFCELVLSRTVNYQGEDLSVFEVSKKERRPIKAVGWVGKELDEKQQDRYKLASYFGDYHKEVKKKDKVDYQSLKSFLRKIDGATIKEYRNKIIDAMLHILRIQGVTYQKNSKRHFYTKTTLLAKLAEAELLDKFNKECSKWILEIDNEGSDIDEIRNKVKAFFLNELFPVLEVNARNREVVSFLDSEIDDSVIPENAIESQNLYCYPGIEDLKVEVSNIHQVKGETHTATLYLETYYQGRFESESITGQ